MIRGGGSSLVYAAPRGTVLFDPEVPGIELLSSLVFEVCRSCGDLVGFGGFNSIFERDTCDDFGKVVKSA